MYELIDREGAHVFLETTIVAWQRRLIAGETLEARMEALRDLIDGREWPWRNDEPVAAEDWHGDDPRPDWRSGEREDRWEYDIRVGGQRVPDAGGSAGEVPRNVRGEPPAVLYLTTQAILQGASHDIRLWEFHKGDADPNPSVPHGHHLAIAKRKLDPYTGSTYDSGVLAGRLKRSDVAGLWCNHEFREFVREALDHFICNNPNYCFRVANPRKLPRKRRPRP